MVIMIFFLILENKCLLNYLRKEYFLQEHSKLDFVNIFESFADLPP